LKVADRERSETRSSDDRVSGHRFHTIELGLQASPPGPQHHHTDSVLRIININGIFGAGVREDADVLPPQLLLKRITSVYRPNSRAGIFAEVSLKVFQWYESAKVSNCLLYTVSISLERVVPGTLSVPVVLVVRVLLPMGVGQKWCIDETDERQRDNTYIL
jgi:hypothetical protein